jgi:hypothetical protein
MPRRIIAMWCFSVKDGRIASVKDLNGLSDQEAIEKAKLFFEAGTYDTFEVWDGKRMVYQHLAQPEKGNHGRDLSRRGESSTLECVNRWRFGYVM